MVVQLVIVVALQITFVLYISHAHCLLPSPQVRLDFVLGWLCYSWRLIVGSERDLVVRDLKLRCGRGIFRGNLQPRCLLPSLFRVISTILFFVASLTLNAAHFLGDLVHGSLAEIALVFLHPVWCAAVLRERRLGPRVLW